MDGSGKTTQIQRLATRLRAQGKTVLETAEPGGPPISQKIRHILLDSAHQELSPRAELLLYFAARAQNVDQWILPALERGDVVLSDRYTDSSIVYQGYARGLGVQAVNDLHSIACRGLQPKLTILVDIDVETSLARAHARNAAASNGQTRMDDQSLEFHQAAWNGYHFLAAANQDRFRIVDGKADPDTIEREIWEIVKTHV